MDYTLPLYLGMVIIGYIFGYIFRKKNINLNFTGKFQTILVFIIILIMGLRIGSKREVIDNFKIIGIASLLFTLFTQGISIFVLHFGRIFLRFDRYGIRHVNNENVNINSNQNVDKKVNTKLNMMTIYIFISALVGMLLGIFVILNLTEKNILFNGDISIFENITGLLINILLCLLLLFVGHDLGKDENTIGNIKKSGFFIVLFPIFTVVGVFIGSIITALILKLNIIEALAIGSGFGWYSLAPNILIRLGLDNAAAISFLHNVMREIVAIFFIPIVAKKIGYIETTTLAGAAGMDVCLPIVESSTSPLCAIYSFVSGVILTIFVPIFVTFFATIVA